MKAPPALPYVVVPSSAYDSSQHQKRSFSVATDVAPLFIFSHENDGIPEFAEIFLFTSIILSSTVRVDVLRTVFVPSTIKFPCTLVSVALTVNATAPLTVVVALVPATVTLVEPEGIDVADNAANEAATNFLLANSASAVGAVAWLNVTASMPAMASVDANQVPAPTDNPELTLKFLVVMVPISPS